MDGLGLTMSEVSQWFSTATDFKGKYADFQKRVAEMRSASIDANKYPALAKERAALIARAESIDSKVKSTVQAVDAAYEKAKYYMQHPTELVQAPVELIKTGAATIYDWAKSTFGLNGLGVLPVLIPVAVIGTAAASIVYWLNDANTLSKKIAEQKRLEAKGIPADQAAKIVAQTFASSGGILGNIKGIAMWGAIGLGAFLAFKAFTRKDKQS